MGHGMADGSGPVLLATKLRPPPVRDQIVPRERLVERLRTGSGLRLTLVACPPGFGKTTVLAAWHEVEAARKPVAWLTLDEGDNDPAVLWSYVIEAFRRACPAIGRPASALVLLFAIVWFLPNSMEMLWRFDPALNSPYGGDRIAPARRLSWSPTRANAAVYGLVCIVAILALSNLKPFIYFQF